MSLFPDRMRIKPNWMQLARFSINENVKDAATIGDRTLAIFIG